MCGGGGGRVMNSIARFQNSTVSNVDSLEVAEALAL